MSKPTYRVYLVLDRAGHLRQTPRRTRDFYDIDTSVYLNAPQTRWYRIVRTSPGRAFNTLWEAGRPEVSNNVTVCSLGAFMKLISNQWYVDARDIRIEEAADLNRGSLTRPRVLALLLTVIVLAYFLLSNQAGLEFHAFQPVARFSGLTILALLIVEQLLNLLKRWKWKSQNSD